MNVNKKFDRFKQWAGEKMGNEARTNTSDDFRALEMEMNLRAEGMDRLHKSMSLYVKAMGKKNECEEREKLLPVGYLGATMTSHGQDFERDSEFGNCLISFGRSSEALARRQETFVANATASWLESLERSVAQMKEYQAARKKLEARRLAYDASLAKMQKAKKEDFRVEEELRSQKAKYEESSEDVYRRMEDIKEAEVESVADLSQFLEHELAYYDSCREILLQLKRDWPGVSAMRGDVRDTRRARSNTAHSYTEKYNEDELAAPLTPKTTIPKLSSRPETSSRQSGLGSPREYSGGNMPVLMRISTEPSAVLARTALRPTKGINGDSLTDDYNHHHHYNGGSVSPDRIPNGHSWSPTRAQAPTRSNTTSWSAAETTPSGIVVVKKGPPPPPPSRAKKPAPPPPIKRSAFSTSEIPQA